MMVKQGLHAVNPQVSHFDMEKKVITHPVYDKCEQNTACSRICAKNILQPSSYAISTYARFFEDTMIG